MKLIFRRLILITPERDFEKCSSKRAFIRAQFSMRFMTYFSAQMESTYLNLFIFFQVPTPCQPIYTAGTVAQWCQKLITSKCGKKVKIMSKRLPTVLCPFAKQLPHEFLMNSNSIGPLLRIPFEFWRVPNITFTK